MKNFLILLLFLFSSICFSIDSEGSFNNSSNGNKYILGEDGIHIFINVWGHVNSPGRIMIIEGSDIATVLSVVGGPKKGANLSNIKLYRETFDKETKIAHSINLESFFNDGDRSGFIEIEPNDTIIISQTTSSKLFESISSLNTILNLINLFLIMNSK